MAVKLLVEVLINVSDSHQGSINLRSVIFFLL